MVVTAGDLILQINGGMTLILQSLLTDSITGQHVVLQ